MMRLLERWRSRPDPATCGQDAAADFPDTVVQEAEDGIEAAARFEHLLDALAQRPEEPVSLTVALPFCISHCLCCERAVQAAQPQAVIDDYLELLLREVQAIAHRSGSGRDALQLHLGGGSPTELNASQLARLHAGLQQAWRLPADAELSVECDPRRTSWQQLQLLRGLGYSRVTFGVLDFDPQVQQAIGRSQSTALIDDVCRLARECGFDIVTLDLMLGLPLQTESQWQATVQQVLTIAPDRIRLKRWVGPLRDAVPSLDSSQAQAADLAAQTRIWLARAGYFAAQDNQFVLDTDELVGAATQGRVWRSRIAATVMPPTPLLALGAGAVGEIDGFEVRNEASLQAWQERVRAGQWSVAQVRSMGAENVSGRVG